MNKRFSTFLTLSLLGFSAFSILLMIGTLYGLLSSTMQREFENELKACQAEVAMILQDRFNLVENRVKETCLDNAIRVNLMLGVTRPLEELLVRNNPLVQGADFHVRERGTGHFIPGLPVEEAALATRLEKLGEAEGFASLKFMEDENGRILSLFSSPVTRKDERLGTVYAVYELAGDALFWKRFHRNTLNKRLFFKRHDGLVELREDSPLFIPLATGEFLSADEVLPSPGHFTQESLIAIKEFPGLFLSASSESFMQKKRVLVGKLAIVSCAIFLFALLLSLTIGRGVSGPLKAMADQAMKISGESSVFFLNEEKIRYREFLQLAMAFNLVLKNLQEAQEKEHRARKYLDIILNTMPDPVFVKDADLRIGLANDAYCRFVGLPRASILGKTCHDLVSADEANMFEAHDRLVLSTKEEGETESKMTDTKGRVRLISTRKKAFTDPNTGSETIVGVIRNITDAKNLERELARHRDHLSLRVEERTKLFEEANEKLRREIEDRKHAEKTLKLSEEKYRLVVDNAHEGIYITQDRLIKFANPNTERILGFSRQELENRAFWEIVHPEDREFILQRYLARVAGEEVPGHYTFRALNKSGKSLDLDLNAVRIELNGKPAVLCFIRDITQTRLLENQLRQSHKMQAIGTLAGGISHDFNNILSAIMGYTELCLHEAENESPMARRLDRVLQSSHRAKDLVNQILTFTRQKEQEKRPIRAAAIVREATHLLRASMGSSITFRQDIQEKTGKILADPTQIHQVVMNICTNAGHAMGENGGVLSIGLDRFELNHGEAEAFPDIAPGPYLRLSVSDTGHGMSVETVEKIFDPYFTTKKQGEGTGLGLSTVHGIVKSLNGTIRVYSQVGNGTTFKLYLPLIETCQKGLRHSEPVFPTGSETILLVDDETFVLDMTQEVLEGLGYRVQKESSSPGALKTFRSRPHRYDLVITDLTMPEMTGKELAKKIHQVRAAVPIILCTGFAAGLTAEAARPIGIGAVLNKPVLKRELAETIRQLLDHPPGA